jgi:CDP-glycerol glycerophosphotransferase (TagB/SpsB family)
LVKARAGAFLRYLWLGLLAPPLWLLYALTMLIPRTRSIWVFGAWDGARFADNTKWLFLHCLEARYPERFVWITRNRRLAKRLRGLGYDAHHHRSLRGLWLSLRAKVFVIDHTSHDISFFSSRGSVKVCLFHGIPLKRLRRDVLLPGTFNHMVYHGPWPLRALLRITRPYLYERYSLVIATSPRIAADYCTAFGTPMKDIAITGYPRNDALWSTEEGLDSDDRESRRGLESLRRDGRKIIMYLPTWRDHGTHGSIPLQYPTITAFLDEHDAVLVTKFHSYDDRSDQWRANDGRLIVLDHHVDVYPLLPLVDVLVTDYSSVSFDFLLLRRPVVYYCYDLEEYRSGVRGFYHDYGSVTPGAKASTHDELLLALKDALSGTEYMERWRTRYELTLDTCHSYRDAGSGERVYREIRLRFG